MPEYKSSLKKPTDKLLRAALERVAGNGTISSIYKGEIPIVSFNKYRVWMEDPVISRQIYAAVTEYDRVKKEEINKKKEEIEALARICLEEILLSHSVPKIAKTKTVHTKYITKGNSLVVYEVNEMETTSEIYFRCPPKILEMILPPVPRTTIDVMATQMVNEGVMPQKKAEVIAAIADRAQSDIREVISGASDFEA